MREFGERADFQPQWHRKVGAGLRDTSHCETSSVLLPGSLSFGICSAKHIGAFQQYNSD